MKLLDVEARMLREVETITRSDYEINENNEIDPNNLLSVIEELLGMYKYAEEKLTDYVKYVDDNYKPMTKEEQIYG